MNKSSDLPTIVMTGPTASGKTKKAIQLAKSLNAEIVCADSRIVYRGFDIASAKPTPEEQLGVVHHLIDIQEPVKLFSAGDFVAYAKRAIEDIRQRGKNVIIAGGTWFYIKALLDKEDLPEIPQNKRLREELSKNSPETLWEMLKNLDPKRAEDIHKNNVDKVIRSIEMCKHLNAPISEHKRPQNNEVEAVWYMPKLERAELYERINARVDEMVKQGLLEEFSGLIKKYGPNDVISNTIGYRELLEYEDKALAIEKIKQHTRNFAKRQLTWFRAQPYIKDIEECTH